MRDNEFRLYGYNVFEPTELSASPTIMYLRRYNSSSDLEYYLEEAKEGILLSEKTKIVPLALAIRHTALRGRCSQIMHIPFKTSLSFQERASPLKVGTVMSHFDIPFQYERNMNSTSRQSHSRNPERIDPSYTTVFTHWMTLFSGGLFEQLSYAPLGEPMKMIMQPVVVVGFYKDVQWRNTIRIDEVGNIVGNSDNIKVFVASEFDSPYSWDVPLRNYYRKQLVPLFSDFGLEIIHVPWKEFREDIIYKPDFSGINPLKDNSKKMLRDVREFINNYYPSFY